MSVMPPVSARALWRPTLSRAIKATTAPRSRIEIRMAWLSLVLVVATCSHRPREGIIIIVERCQPKPGALRHTPRAPVFHLPGQAGGTNVARVCPTKHRHGRACPGHPRFYLRHGRESGMAGPEAGRAGGGRV